MAERVSENSSLILVRCAGADEGDRKCGDLIAMKGGNNQEDFRDILMIIS